MAALPTGVPLEERSGLVQHLRRHRQVDLRVRQMGVSEIKGELMHKPLDIRPLAVPFCEPMDCEGVAIMPISA